MNNITKIIDDEASRMAEWDDGVFSDDYIGDIEESEYNPFPGEDNE